MPVTPFHFGPGLLLKAAAPRQLSFTAFVAANVLIDVESAYYLFTGGWPVHRTLYTFLFGTAAGLFAGYIIYVLGQRGLRWSGRIASAPGLRPALLGGMLGGLTHAVLDGVMHSDMHPLRPFAEGNPLLRATDLLSLHLFCLAAGALGLLWGARPVRLGAGLTRRCTWTKGRA